MTTETALTIPERAAVALNSAKVTDELRALVAASSDILAVIDGAGREQAHRIGMNLKNSRIAIEKAGKSARDDATKFSKGVIAEEARLVAIIEPEESRVFGLRDKWDAKIEEEKQAKIAAERVRIEEIQKKIDEFGALALQAVGRDSRGIDALQQILIGRLEGLTEELFEESFDKAKAAYAAAESSLDAACKAAMQAEQDAEAARIKREEEDRQRAAEAAENARQKAELDRVAAEQAAERKRLDDAAEAQRVELERQKKEADEKIKADAAAETKRIQAEADARALEHAKAMQALNDQRAAFEAEQAVAQKAKEAEAMAATVEADHAEALKINADLDAAYAEWALAQKVSAPSVADALIADALDLAPLHEAINEPTDEEIVAVYMDAFGGTAEAAIERLRRIAL